jgi:hydroxyquinol 1,2-dioxygenase
MTQYDDQELTAEVVRSFAATPNPRLKSILTELVKSLHGFVRRTDLTFDEWNYAIDFFTRTGQTCTSTRQEFILLSDVLGVSMLVDAVNHREREGATQTTVLGPFYVGEHKPTRHGTDISAGLSGEPMFVRSRITDLEGRPLANVEVDASTILKSRLMRPGGLPCGPVSSPIATAVSRSGRSCHAAIRYQPTDRSAN